ncbi:Putative lemA protein [Vibrio nigripulchritudo SOn1]|uniref:LemA protein n=1 Tax=Vibrio nigripulchritudo SOn1 TaxID=1238450 RepID=A0AAV2VVK3_9VIBR|nr:LemA family protein [Vibrio nigripulchritudo]CCO48722.1 Putative lemA protein [Vibrio nigripulchritudo SOn1]
MDWVIIGLVVVFLLFCIMTYNGLIAKKNQVENAESSIDVMLKKRFDLIPNLVESVKAYTKHESSVLTELTDIRSKATSGNLSSEDKVELDKRMNQALSQFNVTVEAYPELKASENFSHLQRTLNEVEEQISAARRSFNAAVTNLNNAVEMFPSNIFANFMGLTTRTLFEIPEAEKANPNVGSLFGN